MKNLATLFLAAIFLYFGSFFSFATFATPISNFELSVAMIISILSNIGSIRCFAKLPNNQVSWQFIRCVGRLLSEFLIIYTIIRFFSYVMN